MHHKPFSGRAPPGPAGELTALPQTLSWTKGVGTREGEGDEGTGTGGEKEEGRREGDGE